MQKTEFDISHSWTLTARPEELTEIVLDPELLHRWGGKVFMRGEVLEQGQPDGLGMRIRLHSKGWLPHSFLMVAEIIDLEAHKWMTIKVDGDFDGIGDLSVTPIDQEHCTAVLRWRTDINHPQLRYMVRFLRPVLNLNHRWAVNSVSKVIQKEIDRRRAGNADIAPVRPTFGLFVRFLNGLNKKRAKILGWGQFDDPA